MSLAWHDLHGGLLRSSVSYSFQRGYAAIRAGDPVLQRFGDPVAVLEFLHRSAAPPDAKNTVLKALVAAARPDWSTAEVAQTMLLLALWPGLDAVRQRAIGRWRLPNSTVAGEVLGLATQQIARLDLDRVTRIAATVLRNIERDLGRTVLRERNRGKDRVDIDLDLLAAADSTSDPDDRVVGLMARVPARDARLIRLVVIEGRSRAEAGTALGITEVAARKRVQRLMARLVG